MFLIRLWDEKIYNSDIIGIKCKNCKRTMTQKLQNEELNSTITPFIIHAVLYHVGLSWIFHNKKNLKFEI